MKKLFTLLSACTLVVTANSQTYFSDDFEGGSLTGNNAWTQVFTVGSQGTHDWYWDTFSGDNFAEINNYPDASDVWMISPVIDLSGQSATNPYLSFQNTSGNFDGPDLEVYVSSTYGGGAINMGDWTQLTGWNLSPGSGDGYTDVNSGDIDLTSVASSSTVYIAFRYQSAASSAQEYQIDNVLIQEGMTVVPTLSIYDVQYSTANPADSPEDGNTVNLHGVVTSLASGGDSGDGYFMQDADGAWNGLMIVDGTNTPNVGDSVEVTGVVEENFDMTRLVSISAFTNHGTPTVAINPVVITSAQAASMEDYESVMVTVEAAECTVDNAGFGLWTMNDGSGDLNADDDCFDNSATLGNYYDVTGIISYTYSEYKINPRTGADMVVVGNASIVTNTIDMNIYPNPADEQIVINAAPNAVVAIYNMAGQVVANGVSNKTIDVASLEAGIYQVVITVDGSQSAQKLVIK
ncbi:T9SS type A sorting domain-containing protein [Paracrocinitomix mangrovi]|uniref:T9SS-dependent choice-of-anchor J family protein n=1 Tax=Paracrocinitomix mangrovi TaxID=2862509 RepID=UPI001C8D9D4D|nr:T9SS type A sorting domain-containing protein [Paracrocinitomix mangrovi]UKN02093.1 T9SS type A sorting domain-containing protein [Paracrocinitomix mangrovi]